MAGDRIGLKKLEENLGGLSLPLRGQRSIPATGDTAASASHVNF